MPDALPRDFNQINVLQYFVLFTQKANGSPTLQPSRLMSAIGVKRTCQSAGTMSASDRKADIGRDQLRSRNARFSHFVSHGVIGFYRHAAAGFHRIAWWGE